MTPRVRILLRIEALLNHADLAGMSGVADIKVRHTRNRWAAPDEKPCISIRMVSDETDADPVTQGEVQHELIIDLQVDADLQTEDSGLDPTGIERLGQIANAAMTVLLDRDAEDADGNVLRGLCDGVIDGGVQPDEDSESDEARFIHRIIVLYRTSIEDPNLLLSHEESLP